LQAERMTMAEDYARQRTKMVDGQLRTTDVTDIRILDIMGTLPREAFLPPARQPLAYIDEDVRIADGRYLMEPSPFAKLLQLAEVGPSDRVLDVGSGTGYSAAVLAGLAAAVVALESDGDLAAAATVALAGQGIGNVEVVNGPLEAGHAAKGPYDLIFVEGSVEQIPAALFAQLAEGGRLLAVVGVGNAGRATIYEKSGGAVSGRPAFNAAVKPLPGFAREPVFEF